MTPNLKPFLHGMLCGSVFAFSIADYQNQTVWLILTILSWYTLIGVFTAKSKIKHPKS